MAVSFVICVSYMLISTKCILKLLGGMNWYKKVFFFVGGMGHFFKGLNYFKATEILILGENKREKD